MFKAGAGCGEFLSNTIFFELKQNWRGLLVEPNPDFFPDLKSKNRNAWILPHCLSPSRQVELVDFDAALYNGGIIVPDRDYPSDLGWQSHFSTFYDRPEMQNERSMTVINPLKLTKKFNIASEASYVYILSGQKLIKKAKNGQSWRA